VIFVGVDDRVAGVLAIADPIKETSAAAIATLQAEGIRVVMLTGDNRTTANAVARKLGIVEIEAEVLPDQKIAVVARLKNEGRGRWRERRARAGCGRRRHRDGFGH
jgi:Cu+-exporting ATPase